MNKVIVFKSKFFQYFENTSLLFILTLIIWTGCSRESTPHKTQNIIKKRGGTFHLVIPIVSTLDPLYVDDVYESAIINNIYNGLVKFGDRLQIIPDLAKEWKVSRNGKEYLFILRKNVYFHNGSPLSAEDVIFTFARCMKNPSQGGAIREILKDLLDYDVVNGKRKWRIFAKGKRRVKIYLKYPYPEFLKLLASDPLKIVPKNSFPLTKKRKDKPFIGTGPFVLKSISSRKIVLVRNKSYFNGAPYIDKVEFLIRDSFNPKTLLKMFQKREIDILNAYFVNDFKKLVPADHLILKAELTTSFMIFNCKKYPTSDVNFRNAFITAFDRNEFFKNPFMFLKPTESLLPPGIFGYFPFSGKYAHPLNQIVDFLSKVNGITDFKGPLLYLAESSDQILYNQIQKATKRLDLKIEMKTLPWNEYFKEIKTNNYHITSIAWNLDTPIPEQFYKSLLFSLSPQNISNYSDPEIDKLINRMFFEENLNVKLDLIRQFEGRVQRNVPLMPLENYIMAYAINPEVDNVKMNAFGIASLDLSKAWFTKR